MERFRIEQLLGILFMLFALVVLVISIFPNVAILSTTAIPAAAVAAVIGFLISRSRKLDYMVDLIAKETGAITAYERASELIGLRGFLRITNITGMPFATIAMTLTFCFLAFLSHAVNAIAAANTSGESAGIIPATFPQAVLELAKLTLGAFIGSFVNRVPVGPDARAIDLGPGMGRATLDK
jgi:hypothetical protein